MSKANGFHHIRRFEKWAKVNPLKRRALFEAVFHSVNLSNITDFIPLFSPDPFEEFIFEEDVPYLIELLKKETDNTKIFFLVKVIEKVWIRGYDNNDRFLSNLDLIDLVWNQSQSGIGQKVADFEEVFNRWLKPIHLDSEEAISLRTNFEKEQERITGVVRDDEEALQYRTPILIEKILEQIATNKISPNRAWWSRICRVLHTGPDGKGYVDDYMADITQTAGWDLLDANTKAILLEIGKNYILKPDKQTVEFLNNTPNLPSFAGYKALHFWQRCNPHEFERLSPDVLEAWIRSIITFAPLADAVNQRVIQIAFERCPSKFLDEFKACLDMEADDKPRSCLVAIQDLWKPGDVFSQILLKKAKSIHTPNNLFREILSLLISGNDSDTISWARARIKDHCLATEPDCSIACVVAAITNREHHGRMANNIRCNESRKGIWQVPGSCY